MKPSLFKNEFLATSDPLNTIVFEGLWCMADREGRLEDRPRRIHLEVNAGRAYEGTEAAIAWLADNGFILRYAHGADRYIQVVNFQKHQNPHPREAASVIPEPGLQPEAPPRQDLGNALALSSPALSPSLNPLSPSPFPLEETTAAARPAEPPEFAEFRLTYPERNGNQPWGRALKACRARLVEGHTWAELIAGADRYARWCWSTGKLNTEHVMQAATFCGPEKPFAKPWTPPASKADVRMASNIDAAAEAERRIFGGT